jgi:GntR family transcriptional regulator, transcriptional repressor for pyruvate dehydrogenase complex
MKFERVQQVRLHEQIIARFNEMADAGHINIGDRLPPERELLTQFGVSRQVLREALTVMESQGMLSTTPGGGRVFRGRTVADITAFVESLKESALFEILDAREAIECKVAELAALHASDTALADLRQRIRSLQASSYTFEWNYGFHLAIAEASANTVLHNLLQLLLQARRDVHREDYLTREQLERLFEDHAAIIDALERRDPAAARSVMLQHIATTRSAFQQRQAELAHERRGDHALS